MFNIVNGFPTIRYLITTYNLTIVIFYIVILKHTQGEIRGAGNQSNHQSKQIILYCQMLEIYSLKMVKPFTIRLAKLLLDSYEAI